MSLQQLGHQPLIFSRNGGQPRPYIRHEKPHVECRNLKAQMSLFRSSNPSLYYSAATVGKQGLTSAMKNPMSNIIFGMAPALFQIGTPEDVISNAPAPR
jgi:hypothetical protein